MGDVEELTEGTTSLVGNEQVANETAVSEGPKSPLVRALLHVKWASFMQNAGKNDNAAEHFAKSLALFPSARAFFGLGTCLAALRRRHEALEALKAAVKFSPDMVGALVNLAGVELSLGLYGDAEVHCRRALELEPGSKEALMNLANVLRNMGRRPDAISIVWGRIRGNGGTIEGEVAKPVSSPLVRCSAWESIVDHAPLVVVCLKWGKRYDAAYVNRLCFAVKRNLHGRTLKSFICFTEDAVGIDSTVEIRTLPTGLPLWWGKAYLFSAEAGLDGHRVLFLDLDQIVVGDLCELVAYAGPFALLATDGIACELAQGGYNSSVISWEASSFFRPIYEQLTPRVLQHVHRFDHWLEMMIDGADLWQQLAPQSVVDYTTVFRGGVCIGSEDVGFTVSGDDDWAGVASVAVASGGSEVQSAVSPQEPPAGCAVVTFPRHPKPHDVVELHFWARDHWLADELRP